MWSLLEPVGHCQEDQELEEEEEEEEEETKERREGGREGYYYLPIAIISHNTVEVHSVNYQSLL